MKEMPRYEKIILVLTAVFVALCALLFCVGRSDQGYTVTVTERTPEDELLSVQSQADGTPDSLIPGEKINVNTAAVLDLARLPGIGETRANAIADYRTQHGSFTTVDDLLLVEGIGEKTLENLRPYVTVK